MSLSLGSRVLCTVKWQEVFLEVQKRRFLPAMATHKPHSDDWSLAKFLSQACLQYQLSLMPRNFPRYHRRSTFVLLPTMVDRSTPDHGYPSLTSFPTVQALQYTISSSHVLGSVGLTKKIDARSFFSVLVPPWLKNFPKFLGWVFPDVFVKLNSYNDRSPMSWGWRRVRGPMQQTCQSQ